jgi:hypothetical protein
MPSPSEKVAMNPAIKSLTLCACFCISSGLVFAQGTTCAADGGTAQGSPIACVTGEGVAIKAAADSAASSEVLPLTPEQRPATLPTVIFENGKLTIIAKNAVLGDILRIVGEKTGAAIDVPDAASERVVSQLGPGPARDVIASLLNGSHFNYVMVGNEADPNAVARVVLTSKGDHGDSPASGNNAAPTMMANGRPTFQPRTAMQRALVQPYQEMLQQQAAQQVTTPDFQQPPLPSAEEAPAPAPAPQNQAAAGEGATTPSAAPAPAGPSGTETAAIDPPSTGSGDGTPKNANAEKTPQQMLQDLYETRRQMMQQQQKPQPPQ